MRELKPLSLRRRNRVELYKTVKPTDPKFLDKFNELRRKNAKYLGSVDISSEPDNSAGKIDKT